MLLYWVLLSSNPSVYHIITAPLSLLYTHPHTVTHDGCLNQVAALPQSLHLCLADLTATGKPDLVQQATPAGSAG